MGFVSDVLTLAPNVDEQQRSYAIVYLFPELLCIGSHRKDIPVSTKSSGKTIELKAMPRRCQAIANLMNSIRLARNKGESANNDKYLAVIESELSHATALWRKAMEEFMVVLGKQAGDCCEFLHGEELNFTGKYDATGILDAESINEKPIAAQRNFSRSRGLSL